MMRRGLVVAGAGVVLLYALSAPATTRQGVNFVVSATRIPRYVKILGFLHRDAQYRLLAGQITEGLAGDEARAIAVFRWTRAHILATPAGWPIVDDHVLHIIIRGHGVDDQMADVFTTLLTYAGVPAFWKPVSQAPRASDGGAKPAGTGPLLILSFAKVDGRWTVFDIAENVIFADAQGRLLDVRALAADPVLAEATAGGVRPGGLSYADYLVRLRPFTVPGILRAQTQMPWPRVAWEARRVLRLDRGAPVASTSMR